MTYTSAVIKETMRLWPPAASGRMTMTPYQKPSERKPLTVRTSAGEEFSLQDVNIYHCNTLIHRDPEVYGDTANQFMPERWLHKSESESEIPASAWRGFERGPRNCIGQELATIEARVVVALVARRYKFVKVSDSSICPLQMPRNMSSC